MAFKVLVAYATNAGSTQEVSEVARDVLTGHGISADILPAKNVRDTDGYDMVILGAPLYMFRWHTDAHRFLGRNRNALEKQPVAIFALGPIEDKQEQWDGARAQLDKELSKYAWLTPAAVDVFGGKFDPNALRFPYSLIPALKKMPPCELRDWTVIRTWTENLVEKFILARE